MIMKSMTDSGEVQEYQGTKLSPAIAYSFSWEEAENVTEAKNGENWPSDSEILKFVNGKAKTSAKAQAYQKATADLKKAYENTPEFKRKNLIAAALVAGMSQEQAEALAASIV